MPNTINSQNDASQRKKDIWVEQAIRPTLFIAIGGTGMEICMRLRRRILNHSWGPNKARLQNLTEFPIASFINFDLDSGSNIDSSKSQATDLQYELVKFAEGEKVVEAFNLDTYTGSEDALARYPHIEKWMPLTPRKIRELNIDPSKGAGQIRSVSRLYFFDKYTKIKSQIANKLGDLKANLQNSSALSKLGLTAEEESVRIIVIGSMAGGTGSGSFLDMGYLAKKIGSEVFPKKNDVELLFLSPSGFKAANQERTEANGYAALMELETLLSPNSSGMYLEKWEATTLAGSIPAVPYDTVYILETGNIAGQNTQDVKDVYQMTADSFFADFMSESFPNKKRSIAVNQKQHKLEPYAPPLNTKKYGDAKVSYKQSYSSFGLSMMSNGVESANNIEQCKLASNLLKVYFGVSAENQNANAVEDRTLEEFLKSKIDLSMTIITPPNQIKNQKHSDVGSFALVNQLLMLPGSNKKVLDTIDQQCSDLIDDVTNKFVRKDWKAELKLVQRSLEQSTITDIDTKSKTNEEKLSTKQMELLADYKIKIRKQLFDYMDNAELGGLEYVLSFIKDIKQKIDNDATGYSGRLKKNARLLSEWKSELQNEIEKTYQFLDQVSGNALFGDNQKKAEAKIEHIKSDIAEYLKCHIQIVASNAAAELLNNLSEWLGVETPAQLGSNLPPQWSGLAGRFQKGKSSVQNMIAKLNKQISIYEDDKKSVHSMHININAAPITFKKPDKNELRKWAEEAFEGLGKSEGVFIALEDESKHYELMNDVLSKADTKLDGLRQSKTLIETLNGLDSTKRQDLFVKLFKCAFPWIQAQNLNDEKNYKIFLGVANSTEFEKYFGDQIKYACSVGGLNLKCEIVDTGNDGVAICYCEITGYPLDKLTNLANWRESYAKALQSSNPIPVHTHKDSEIFKHPDAASDDELEELAKDFQMFIKAVMLGVVLPRKDIYGFYISRGNFNNIGTEQLIRRDGVFDRYEESIVSQCDVIQNEGGDEFKAAYFALCKYYVENVYSTKKAHGTITIPIKGLSTHVLEKMADSIYPKSISSENKENIRNILLDPNNVNKWSKVIPNTAHHIDKTEVHEFTEDELEHKNLEVYVKRTLSENWKFEVSKLLNMNGAHSVSVGTVPPPAPGAGRLILVAIGGKQSGPYPEETIRTMVKNGELDPGKTHVWWEGCLDGWQLLNTCPQYLPSMQNAPPPPPPIS
jgi:hypothetical protein